MTDLTRKLVEASNGILTLSPEPTDMRYQSFDSGGVEESVGVFLHGLMCVLKPERVLTTGVFTGISDLYIAKALQDNGFGKVTALEFEPQHLERAQKLWQLAGVHDYIQGILTPSLGFTPSGLYQFMFLDTEVNLRFHELAKFYPHLAEGGYVFIHDMPYSLCQDNVNPDHPSFLHWPIGEIPIEIKELVNTGKLRPMFFPSPRGLLGFYKPRKDEYSWL